MTATPCEVCNTPHDNDDTLCTPCFKAWLESDNQREGVFTMPNPPIITDEDTKGNCPECGVETNKTISYDATFVFVAETLCPECDAKHEGVLHVD